MKTYLNLGFCLLLASLLSPMANANFKNCTSSYGEWDWSDSSNFVKTIPTNSPFGNWNNYNGAMSEPHHHCPEDGWVLLVRHIYCEDNLSDTSDECKDDDYRSYLPKPLSYFSLYNKYTGMVRFFVYVDEAEAGDSFYFNISAIKNQASVSPAPILINSTNPVTTMDSFYELNDFSKHQQERKILRRSTEVWSVFDTFVSYPGEILDDRLGFSIDLQTFNKQDLKIEGKIVGKLSTHIAGTDMDGIGAAKSLYDNRDSIKKAFNDPIDWGAELQSMANTKQLETMGPDAFAVNPQADTLGDLADVILAGSDIIGGINSGYAVYNVLRGFMGSKDSVQNQFLDLDVNLTGTVEDTVNEHALIRVPFPMSYQTYGPESSYQDAQLGLFHIKSRPKIMLSYTEQNGVVGNGTIANRIAGRIASDIQASIIMNPAISDMYLSELKVIPEITLVNAFNSLQGLRQTPNWYDDSVATQTSPMTEIDYDARYGMIKNESFNYQFLTRAFTPSKLNIYKVEGVDDPFSSVFIPDRYKVSSIKDKTLGYSWAYTDYLGSINEEINIDNNRIGLRITPDRALSATNGAPFLLNLRTFIPAPKPDLTDEWNSGYSVGHTSHKAIRDIRLKIFAKFKRWPKIGENEEDMPYFDYIAYLEPDFLLCGGTLSEWNSQVFDNILGSEIKGYELVDSTVCEGEYDSDLDGKKDSSDGTITQKTFLPNPKFDNPYNPDSDRDGLTDHYENTISHTNPNRSDTDGDGFSDWYEVTFGSPFDPNIPMDLGF